MNLKGQNTEIVSTSKKWNTLVSDDTIVYGTWEWGTVCERFGHGRYYIGVEENGEIVAGLPCMYVGSKLFGKELVSMPYSPYGAILSSSGDKHREKLIDAFISLADQLNVAHGTIRGRGLDSEKLQTRSRFVTFEVDLTEGEDHVWNNGVASRFRRAVRKSRKENVRVEKVFNESKLTEYYEMYLDNMQYHGTPPYSRKFFRDVDELLSPNDAFEMYLAYSEDGTPINGVTVFFHGDRAIYWTGVSDHEYRELNGGSRLLWRAIADSCDRGYDTFDLGRTREDTGVYNYKKSIGTPVELIDSHYAPNSTLSLTDPEAEKYEKYKKVWRKLPMSFTEYIGPHLRKRLSM